jgi:hypothetical protein
LTACPGYDAAARLAGRGVLVALIPGTLDGEPNVSAVFGVPTAESLAAYQTWTAYQRAAFLLGAVSVAVETARANGLVTVSD